MKTSTLAIRRYTLGGKLIKVDEHKDMPLPKVRAFVKALLHMGKLFSHEVAAPVNPCNISLRGPKGQFVKWKN